MTDLVKSALVADRYVGRDGRKPPANAGRGLRECLASVDDIVTVAKFLGYQEASDMSGGVKNGEAWLAFCRIVGLPAGEFRQVVTS